MRKLFTINILLMVLLLASCVGESVDYGYDGDEEKIVDGDDGQDLLENPNTGEVPADNQLNYPMLSDPGFLEVVFGRDLESTNIEYGDSIDSTLKSDRPYLAYTFDSLSHAVLTVSLSAKSSTKAPLLALYGPRLGNGMWGSTIAEGEQLAYNMVIISNAAILESGQYLLLVVNQQMAQDDTEFTLALGCHNQCNEPACDDLTCQGFCESGFLKDADGCQTCNCQDAGMMACASDEDCPYNHLCSDGYCKFPSANPNCDCEPIYEPVCGVDSKTYGNACEASCFAISVWYSGECTSSGSVENCEFDSQCPISQVCVAGECMMPPGSCECPQNFDPVCGVDGVTYTNHCELDCRNIDLLYPGACEYSSEPCEPVCGFDEFDTAGWIDSCSKRLVLEGNCADCIAICIDTTDPTDPNNPSDPNDPETESGWHSSCDNSLIVIADCAAECICASIWQPVCGSDSITYTNLCEAECAGVQAVYSGECISGDYGCTGDFDCPLGMICVLGDGCEDFGDVNDNPNECTSSCELPEDSTECTTNADCPDDSTCIEVNGQLICSSINDLSCIITGCNNELCEIQSMQSTCEWQPEYACFEYADCKLDENGTCAWLPSANDTFHGLYEACVEELGAAASCETSNDCEVGYYCESAICIKHDCICPDIHQPVCGENGETYLNICLLNCAGVELSADNSCQL